MIKNPFEATRAEKKKHKSKHYYWSLWISFDINTFCWYTVHKSVETSATLGTLCGWSWTPDSCNTLNLVIMRCNKLNMWAEVSSVSTFELRSNIKIEYYSFTHQFVEHYGTLSYIRVGCGIWQPCLLLSWVNLVVGGQSPFSHFNVVCTFW